MAVDPEDVVQTSNDVKLPASEIHPCWHWVSVAGCISVIALFEIVSLKAGMRGLGILTVIGSGVLMARRRIPYGWEGKAPSGHITGFSAWMVCLLLGALGVAMVTQPGMMLVLFGWAKQ